MKRLILTALLSTAAVPASALTVNVSDVGSILNQSIALPAENTPGSGIGFAEYFEFSLPVSELVTVSMSDSAAGTEQILGGLLSLNNWTTTGPGPLFIPAGALIESSPILSFPGGQSATVSPDRLTAGNYFAEISGVSGASALKIAVDGTATATVPEAPTWAMLIAGAALLGWAAKRKSKTLTSHYFFGGHNGAEPIL